MIISGLAIIVNGLLAGISFDTSLVKLPARRRIGNIAYAVFARGIDLGRGILVYSLLVIFAGLLVFAAGYCIFERTRGSLLMAFIIASITTVIHFIGTAQWKGFASTENKIVPADKELFRIYLQQNDCDSAERSFLD